MRIKYLAHAAFLLTSENGATILTDPYEPNSFNGAIQYQPIDEKVDIITVSHEHADHFYIAPHHEDATLVKEPGEHDFNQIQINGLEVFHDENQGKDRGKNIIFTIEMDHLRVCHLGDLGHELNQDQIEAIGSVDVLLIPVGGVFTLDAVKADMVVKSLSPIVTIPMHYKTDKLNFEIAPVDDFLKDKQNVKVFDQSEIEIDRELLPAQPEIWVLKPSKL